MDKNKAYIKIQANNNKNNNVKRASYKKSKDNQSCGRSKKSAKQKFENTCTAQENKKKSSDNNA